MTGTAAAGALLCMADLEVSLKCGPIAAEIFQLPLRVHRIQCLRGSLLHLPVRSHTQVASSRSPIVSRLRSIPDLHCRCRGNIFASVLTVPA